MLCDVCNATTEEKDASRIPAESFRKLLVEGFGMDETNIPMLTDAGISREAAIDMLTYNYSTTQSEWLLCPGCTAKAESILGSSNRS
jgi:hypothetical protein